jgi:N-hydroxyarylamine O-acetyltransferase
MYLCDVGVGGPAPSRPLRFVEGLEQKQGNESYQLRKDSALGWVLHEFRKGTWRPLYSFTEEPQLPVDFIMPTFYCENSPDSIFRKQAMVSIRTAQGRNTIADKEFRIFSQEGVETFVPETNEAYQEALHEYFGIVLE